MKQQQQQKTVTITICFFSNIQIEHGRPQHRRAQKTHRVEHKRNWLVMGGRQCKMQMLFLTMSVYVRRAS